MDQTSAIYFVMEAVTFSININTTCLTVVKRKRGERVRLPEIRAAGACVNLA